MTVVLVVSTALVTTAAWRGGGSPAAVISVCPGARTTTMTSVAEGATPVAAGSLPAQLASQPDRLRLLPVFRQWASICGIPAALVEATCWWESGWQEGEVSVTGAVGVCQIEPAAAETVRGLLDDGSLDRGSSADNIEMSAAYLRWLLDETGGRQDLALAGYYQGLTSVKEHGILPVSRPYVTGITALLHTYTWS
jgi:soluble lytic murein transglycosylase-like protein